MLGFYLKGLLVAILAGAIAGVVSRIVEKHIETLWVVAVILVVFVAGLVRGAIRQWRTTYSITDRRLTIELGLLSRDYHETRLERVQNVNCRQSLLERMLSVGTVDFDTAGSAEFDFTFRGVEHPRRIARTVDRALHELQRGGQPVFRGP